MFLAVVLSFSSTFAQTPDSAKPARPNSLKPGAWALQFQVNDIFSIRGFQGFGISLKHHFSKSQAIRFGIGSSFATSDFDGIGRSFQADTIRRRSDRDSESDRASVDVSAQYVGYFSPESDVGFFIGAGPLFRFAHADFKETGQFTDFGSTGEFSSSGDEDSWGIGISGVFGAEWFAAKRISFMAEYIMSVEHQTSTRESVSSRQSTFGTETVESKFTANSFRFDMASAKLGLSVYF